TSAASRSCGASVAACSEVCAGAGTAFAAHTVDEALRAAAFCGRNCNNAVIVQAPGLGEECAGRVERCVRLGVDVIDEPVNDAARIFPLTGSDTLVVQAFDHRGVRARIVNPDRLLPPRELHKAVLDAAAVVIPATDVSGIVDRAAGTTGVADPAPDGAR